MNSASQPFNRISRRYRFINKIISLGLDSIWRRATIKSVYLSGRMRILDIGSGPGDLLDLMPESVTKIGIDPEIRMLKQSQSTLYTIQGIGEKLPIRSASIDRVVSAFVLRNLSDRASVFIEIARILVNEGKGALIDFSPPGNKTVGYPIYIYLKYFLPLIGGVLANDFEAYKYLSRTIMAFPQPEVITSELIKSNLKNVRARRLLGGIAVLYTFESYK